MPGIFISSLSQGIWRPQSTYKLYYDLLDNYKLGEGAEVEGADEKAEINTFLEAVMHTKPMR